MNRLNKTESAVFKLWMLYFQRISFQIIWIVYIVIQGTGQTTPRVRAVCMEAITEQTYKSNS